MGESFANDVGLPPEVERQALLKSLIQVIEERMKTEGWSEEPPEVLKRYGMTTERWQALHPPKPKTLEEREAEIQEADRLEQKARSEVYILAQAPLESDPKPLSEMMDRLEFAYPTADMIAAVERHGSGAIAYRAFLCLLGWGLRTDSSPSIEAAARLIRNKLWSPSKFYDIASKIEASGPDAIKAVPVIQQASVDLAASLTLVYLEKKIGPPDVLRRVCEKRLIDAEEKPSPAANYFRSRAALALLGVSPERQMDVVVQQVCDLTTNKPKEWITEVWWLCRYLSRFPDITETQFDDLREALTTTAPEQWHFLVASRAGTRLADHAVRLLAVEWEMEESPLGRPLLQLADAGVLHAQEEVLRAAIDCKPAAYRQAAVEWLATKGGNGDDVKAVLIKLLADDSIDVRAAAARALAMRWIDRGDEPAPGWQTRVRDLLADKVSRPDDGESASAQILRAHLSPWGPEALPDMFVTTINGNAKHLDELGEAIFDMLIQPTNAKIPETLDFIVTSRAADSPLYLALLTYLFSDRHEAMVPVRIAKEALGFAVDTRDRPEASDVSGMLHGLDVIRTPAFRAALGGALAEMCRSTAGVNNNIDRLREITTKLGTEAKKDGRLQSHAETARRCYDTLNWWHQLWEKTRSWVFGGAGTIGLHVLFWTAMLVGYPRWEWVRATMIWNKAARRWLGAGYVGFLLQWVPPLRRLLFKPFRESLLGDARLAQFNAQHYFEGTLVVPVVEENDREREGAPRTVRDAIPRIDGQCLLEGESGLGKTMFVRDLLKRQEKDPREMFVFLPAQRCTGAPRHEEGHATKGAQHRKKGEDIDDNGIRQAIQNLLQGIAKDGEFLDALIYAGALTLVIDGLNEVPADSRERIAAFLRANPRAKVLVTSQRMEWTPPATMARAHWRMQPLSEGQIVAFLQKLAPNGAPPDYPEHCRRYMEETLRGLLASPAREWALTVLSNPFDLSVAAQLLAAGEEPQPGNLLNEAYEAMAREYYAEHKKVFPMEELAAEAYAMRRESRDKIDRTKFAEELNTLKKHRVVVEVMEPGPKDTPPPCRFRHDKLWAYFTVEHFRTRCQLCTEHLGDVMFLQVYQQLVFRLPLDEARNLVQQLGAHAARTGDHSLVDSCLLLLELRTEWEMTQVSATRLG